MSARRPAYLRLIRPDDPPIELPSQILADLIPRYVRSQKALDRQKDGIDQYEASLWQFIAWLGKPNATCADFTHMAVLDYRDSFGERNCAGSTVINALAALHSFAEWAMERKLIDEDPTKGVKRPKKAAPNPQPLTPHQVAILLAVLAEPARLTRADRWRWRRNRRIIYLMLFAGLRMREARELLWCDLIFEEGIINLTRGTKNNKPRRIAIHPELETECLLVPAYERQPDYAVVGLPEGDPLSRGGFEHVFDGWMVTELDIDARLGTHLHAHKLRATFATYFARSGGHLLTLQQLMGHADANTTNYYVQTDDEQKRKEIKQLRFTRD